MLALKFATTSDAAQQAFKKSLRRYRRTALPASDNALFCVNVIGLRFTDAFSATDNLSVDVKLRHSGGSGERCHKWDPALADI